MQQGSVLIATVIKLLTPLALENMKIYLNLISKHSYFSLVHYM